MPQFSRQTNQYKFFEVCSSALQTAHTFNFLLLTEISKSLRGKKRK
uniref:Uncharacterized protein n=1 Tax=Rhizophora mucronata TaxID=61149 RepID=A0A2P2NA81_RHIMU